MFIARVYACLRGKRFFAQANNLNALTGISIRFTIAREWYTVPVFCGTSGRGTKNKEVRKNKRTG
jgi:hypothetical protein